jgi:hypothetical protein
MREQIRLGDKVHRMWDFFHMTLLPLKKYSGKIMTKILK